MGFLKQRISNRVFQGIRYLTDTKTHPVILQGKHQKLPSPQHLSSKTSSFKPVDVRSLDIDYVNVQNADEILMPLSVEIPDHLRIGNIDREQLSQLSPSVVCELDKDEMSIARYVNKVLRNETIGVDVR